MSDFISWFSRKQKTCTLGYCFLTDILNYCWKLWSNKKKNFPHERRQFKDKARCPWEGHAFLLFFISSLNLHLTIGRATTQQGSVPRDNITCSQVWEPLKYRRGRTSFLFKSKAGKQRKNPRSQGWKSQLSNLHPGRVLEKETFGDPTQSYLTV